MLKQISWASFIWFIGTVAAIYYLYVLLAFYRKDIFSIHLINRKTVKRDGNATLFNKDDDRRPISSVQTNTSDNDHFTLVHELLEEFKELFDRASNINMIREELIQSIRSKLKEFPRLQETGLIEDINDHLIQEARNKCQIDLNSEDLKQVWNP